MKKAGTPYLAPLPSSLMVYMGVCTAMQQLPNKRLKQETRLGRCFHLELFIASSNLYRFFGWLNEMAFMTVDLQLVTITKCFLQAKSAENCKKKYIGLPAQ
ncbi:hypothetical protein [Geobacillus vulcani]